MEACKINHQDNLNSMEPIFEVIEIKCYYSNKGQVVSTSPLFL